MISVILVTPVCGDDEFTCDSGYCIPLRFHCDGDYDCGPGDYSDEENETCEGSFPALSLWEKHYDIMCFLC